MKHSLSKALAIAMQAHAGQVRKGTNIPYISHPMAVCGLAMEYGADEEQAMAALLHDAVEDGGIKYADIIGRELGERVLALVQGCTDGVPDANGVKPEWMPRKLAYLAHLRHAPDDVLMVSGADKLHNARAIVIDLEAIGTEVYDRFTASMDDTLWYYQSLAEIFTERQVPMAAALQREVALMYRLSHKPVASNA
jgi:(p)ppGpp synthase/HD superfamily hydrolase